MSGAATELLTKLHAVVALTPAEVERAQSRAAEVLSPLDSCEQLTRLGAKPMKRQCQGNNGSLPLQNSQPGTEGWQ